MAAFAKSWQLTPAKIADPRISYWKNGFSGQLLYRVTMSVSAMKLVDGTGHSQRSGAAIHAGSFSFAAQRVAGSWCRGSTATSTRLSPDQLAVVAAWHRGDGQGRLRLIIR